MRIDMELENPKYCDGCPCLVIFEIGKAQCSMDWYIIENDLRVGYAKYIRPERCIEKRGKI